MDNDIINYMPLALHLSKKYSKYKGEYDDLVMIYLIKAVRSYDSSKGTKLSTYIKSCIQRGLISEWRKDKNPNFAYSLDHEVYDGNEAVSLQDLIIEDNADIDNILEVNETKTLIKKTLCNLNDQERYILQRIYGIDAIEISQTELAKELNITIGCLQKRYRKALKNAKKEIENGQGSRIN